MTVEVESRKNVNGGRAENGTADLGPLSPADANRQGLFTVAAVLRGKEVSLRNSLVGGVSADNVTIERGFARGAIVGQELKLEKAGAGVVVSGGAASLHRAGAQAVVSGGAIHMSQAGSGVALARQVEVGEHGTVVFAITPNLEVRDGGRVIFGSAIGLAVLGALVAAFFGLLIIRRARAKNVVG